MHIWENQGITVRFSILMKLMTAVNLFYEVALLWKSRLFTGYVYAIMQKVLQTQFRYTMYAGPSRPPTDKFETKNNKSASSAGEKASLWF
jgi:hypothetical protein